MRGLLVLSKTPGVGCSNLILALRGNFGAGPSVFLYDLVKHATRQPVRSRKTRYKTKHQILNSSPIDTLIDLIKQN